MVSVAILLILTLDSSAQREIRVRHWTTDDGLPQHRLSGFKQTRDGYLYMETYYGLVRFNGLDFTVFNQFNTPEIPEDTISGLDETPDGTLWMGTAVGLVKYRDRTFYRVNGLEDLAEKKVHRIAASASGAIWVHAGRAVFRFENEKRSREWKFDQVREIQEDKDGWLNVVLDYAWIKISPDGKSSVTNCTKGISAGWWMCGRLARTPDSLWVGGPGFLELIRKGGESTHIFREGKEHIPVTALCEDRDGNLWIGDLEGNMHVWDSQRCTPIDMGHGAKSSSIITIKEDREGSLWVGTRRGLLQIQKLRVRTFTKENGLPDDYVCSVCEDTNKTIWAGTIRGICRIQNDRVVPFDSPEPFPGSRDHCVAPNGRGGLFLSKEKLGLYEFQAGRFSQRTSEKDFTNAIHALYTDRSGRLWIGGKKILLPFDDGKSAPLLSQRSLPDVRCILQDREGTFWLGTKEEGLWRVRGQNVERYTENHGLPNKSVWAIYEDKDGSLWLGTENGFGRLRDGKFFKFTRQHGVTDTFIHRHGSKRSQVEERLVINSILEDDSGYLWLSGMRGLLRIERAQLDAVADGAGTEVECAIINAADGMESSETNGERQPSGWKGSDGRLWFPTTQGLVVVDPDSYKSNTPPPVQIEQVFADDEILYGDFADPSPLRAVKLAGGPTAVRIPNTIQLAAGRPKVIEFHFSANTFVDAKHVRFRYRLLKVDKEWGPVTSERVARYTNLHPGDYVFEVTAADNNGTWNRESAKVEFSIARRFTESWTFYILCGCGVVGVAGTVQAYRLRWQRRLLKLEEQRALANERARIARDLHDDLGTALTGLALELDVAGKSAQVGSGMTERLSQTARHTRQMAERMREVVWSVNPKCDTLSSLAGFLEEQVNQVLRTDTIASRVEFPEDIPVISLGADTRHQLALSVREALTNVVRHAQATEVVLSLAIVGNELVVQIKDNGKGFRSNGTNGHGLENMRARLSHIGGRFECVSSEQTGTAVSFRLPLSESMYSRKS